MNTLVQSKPMTHGRLWVLVLYGSLLAQIVEFDAYTQLHLPRPVNIFQFVALGGQLAGWLWLARTARCRTAAGPRRLDERELALQQRAGWISFRVMGSAVVTLAVGYLLLYDGVGRSVTPSPVGLSMLAYTAFVVTCTLPAAVLAWTQPVQPDDAE